MAGRGSAQSKLAGVTLGLALIFGLPPLGGAIGISSAETSSSTCGPSWAGATAPDPGTVTNSFFSVSGTSASNEWAVGGQQTGSVATALIEYWNGASWAVQANPAPTTQSILYGVSFDSP